MRAQIDRPPIAHQSIATLTANQPVIPRTTAQRVIQARIISNSLASE